MKALISPNENFDISWVSSWSKNEQDQWVANYSQIFDCQRIAEVELQSFDVAEPLFWVDCSDDCKADEWYYKDGQCYIKPQDEPQPE
jgi:hypothetical protein